ncbi:18S rRNA maturation protein [Microbotryomycetes sp. JL201]|nr:18S rRNA maturation protein [Microbotryomycetes sp. JL201]
MDKTRARRLSLKAQKPIASDETIAREDVRTTSERRLEMLEHELEKAQHSQLERKMVLKYKGVRFFGMSSLLSQLNQVLTPVRSERQKLLRKIKQTKRALAESPQDDSLKRTLLNTRVDLAYVLASRRFPKLEKYIALFPEGEYVPHEQPASSASQSDPNATKSAERRWSLRQEFRRKMKNHEIGDAVEDGDLGIEDQIDHQDGESEDEAQDKGENKGMKQKRSRVDDESTKQARPAKKEKRQATDLQIRNPPTKSAEIEQENTSTEQSQGELSRKDKKRLKDARRREAKLQAAAASDSAQAKEGADTSGNNAEAKATTALAQEDDFFA